MFSNLTPITMRLVMKLLFSIELKRSKFMKVLSMYVTV